MLLIWTKDSANKVLMALQPIVAQLGPIAVDNDMTRPPDGGVVLCLGDAPKEFLQERKLLAKNRSILSLRNREVICPPFDQRFMFSYSVGIRDFDHGKYIDLLTDVRLADRLARTGSLEAKLGEYRYVDSLKDAINCIESKWEESGAPVPVTIDTETLGLDPYHEDGYIICIQVTHTVGRSDVLYFKSKADFCEQREAHYNDVEYLLTSPKVRLRAANGKYDMHWFYQHFGIHCTNFSMDTTIVGSLLDENRSNSLTVHAKLYAGDLGGYDGSFNQKFDKSRMDLVPKDEMLPYAGGDTDACYRTSEAQLNALTSDPKLTQFYVNILHPASRAFELLERQGVYIDMERYRELEADVGAEMVDASEQIKKIVGGRLVAKHYDDKVVGGLNVTKASFVKDFMFDKMGLGIKPREFTEKTGEPSTAMAHLMLFKEHPLAGQFVQQLERYSKASKIMSTYVVGFKKHIRSDGRFHPTYFLFVGNRDEGEGGTNCLPAGELVLTSRGYLPVEQVRVGDYVISHTGKPRRVVGTVFNGVKPIVRVRMSNGLVLRTTENHEYRIEDGWVEASKLSVGMQAFAHSEVEEWREVVGWEDFRVSSWGRVLNKKTGSLCKQYPKGKWGHLKVMLRRNGAQVRGENLRDFSVHRLVSLAFLSESYEEGLEVRHKNGVAWDNTVGNLEWGTSGDNRRDAVNHGAMVRRYGNQAKLTDEAVSFIRNQPVATRKGGVTNRQLSEKFGVCERLIRDVRQGRRWGDLPDREKVVGFSKVTVEEVTLEKAVETYGLTVEVDHSHVTGGVVTHNTGRLSAHDPAIQTLPKHSYWGKRLRNVLTAPPGYVVGEADFSQGELRVAACIANEQSMINAYLNGVDMHVDTAAFAAGLTYEQAMELKATDKEAFDMLRQRGKAGNFGLLYGMGVLGFVAYAYANYGVKMLESEAAEFREGFFAKRPGLVTYHETYKEFARKHGYVRSPLGRIRHLPLINSGMREVQAKMERISINSPVQGTLSDLMLWSESEWVTQGYAKDAPAFASIHDASYVYIPEDNVEKFAKARKETMEGLPFEKVGWKPQLTFCADVKVGPSMGELTELKL